MQSEPIATNVVSSNHCHKKRSYGHQKKEKKKDHNSYSSEQKHTTFSEIHVVKDFANLTLKPWLEIYIYGNKKFDTCQRKMVLTLMISI
jgi:hypothetical protein